MSHIEANHIAEICIPCDLCGNIFKSRTAIGIQSKNLDIKESNNATDS